MSKCTKIAHVRNSNGLIVESNLFNDLLYYLEDRELTKEFYAVGTDRDFLLRVRDKAKFDENGEITFASLKELANINISNEKLLLLLNKQIKAGSYSYQEAIARLSSFNSNSQFKDKYMATVRFNNGKYELSVVERTRLNEELLLKEINNGTLQDKLLYYLARNGVSVEFLKEGDRINGRYSTKNALRTAEGLYALISIVLGNNVSSTLAEEAGHFVIGACNESPLVKRLLDILTPSIQKEVLGDLYDEKILGENSRREVAGTLVGKALEKELDKRKPWNKLANRIANLAKRIFYTLKGDEVSKTILEAKEMADKLAYGFTQDNFQGSVENALLIKETLYSAESSTNVKVYKLIISELNLAVDKLKKLGDKSLYELVGGVLHKVEINLGNILRGGLLSESLALLNITDALSLISDMIGPDKEITRLLDSVDITDEDSYITNLALNGRKLKKAHALITLSATMLKIVQDTINSREFIGDLNNVVITDNLGQAVTHNLKEISFQLGLANGNLVALLRTKELKYYAKFCELILGSKYILQTSRVLFKKGGKFGIKLEFFDASLALKLKVEDILKEMESDISLFERYLGSMSNNSDIAGLIADVAIKGANKKANDITNLVWDKLIELEERFKKFGVGTTRILFETSLRSGKLTGNIISELNWGDWEEDYNNFVAQEKLKFISNEPNYDNLTEFEKGVRWLAYFKDLRKEWHKIHSTWDKELNRYVPSSLYDNSEAFLKVMLKHPELENWYKEFLELKEFLDNLLPDGSTLRLRAPLFKGRFINRTRNQHKKSIFEKLGHSIRSSILDTFCESSEDTDFGSDLTYNSKEEAVFLDELQLQKEKIHRIPLFGINKLLDMSELSTDLFQSTLAYASMAASNYALNEVVDILEVGRDVLYNREVNGKKDGNNEAYNRYCKYLDKLLYSISNTKHFLFLTISLDPNGRKIARRVILEKLLGVIARMGSAYFLGGNVTGGEVNTLTGFNELFKEALSDEFFGLLEFMWANKMYFFSDHSFVRNWLSYGKDVKNDRISLFIRHFDTLNDNKRAHRNWEADRNGWTRIYNMFSESIYLPYKSGDHYMSTISYIALARRIKVYDELNNKIALFDAYKPHDIRGTKSRKTFGLNGVFYKVKDGKLTHDLIKSILEKIDNYINLGQDIVLSEELSKYLDNNNINLEDIELGDINNVIRVLLKNIDSIVWNKQDELEFKNKALEINIRMHGIYNNIDLVAFHQNWYGNILLSMRGYALGMIERRFGANKYNTILKEYTEGSLNTLAKVLLSTFTDRGGYALTARALLLPFSKKTVKLMTEAGFSSNLISNMRRNFGDMLLIGILNLLKVLSKKDDDDDDDEDSWALGLLYYFSCRLERELTAFNAPWGMIYELKSVTDTKPAGFSALEDMYEFARLGVGTPFADELDEDYYYLREYGFSKKYDSKFIAKFKSKFPYLRSYYILKDPYLAEKNWEYGLNVKR